MTYPMQEQIEAHYGAWEEQALGDVSSFLTDVFGRWDKLQREFMQCWREESMAGAPDPLQTRRAAMHPLEAEILQLVLPPNASDRDVAQLAWAKQYVRLQQRSLAVQDAQAREEVSRLVDGYLAHRHPGESFRDWHERDKPQADRDQAIAETAGCAVSVAAALSDGYLTRAEAEATRRTIKA